MGRCFPNTMYVWHIYLHEWLIFMVNVGKYTKHWMVWVCVWLLWIRHVWVKHGKTFELGFTLDKMKRTPRSVHLGGFLKMVCLLMFCAIHKV